MIYDTLNNAEQYKGLNADIDKVLEAAKAFTPENFPEGPIMLDGKDVYMNMAKYETYGTDKALVEAHQKYIDVFVMIEGSEIVYVKDVNCLTKITKPYDPSCDALLANYNEGASAIRMVPGSFLILFPQDAHAPCCYVDGPQAVKKVVGKVRIR